METIGQLIIDFSDWIWGWPLLSLLLGGGLLLFLYSGMIPFLGFSHAMKVVRGKYDDPNARGDITSFQALASAVASTVGLGNISGVALAIGSGGPGAIFWMWVSALIGMSTKFFTCTLAIMYRGKDSSGHIQGGPMYVIEEGMGKKWRFLSIIFCVAGILGLLVIFQTNQLTDLIRVVLLKPYDLDQGMTTRWILGVVMMLVVATVILGGLQRIAKVASKLVPFMVTLYFFSVMIILFRFSDQIWPSLMYIIDDAFSGKAVLGGSIGAVIITGARRAAFSNEAGIGTAPMVHGNSKNEEPVREGLIAMLGPFIDTIVVCTLTALTIMVTGVWQSGEKDGVLMTLSAFQSGIPVLGKYFLMAAVLVFALSTMFTYSYYGHKCFNYLFGADKANYYNYFYLGTIVVGAVVSLKVVMSFVDGMYAIMAFPTMISALYLSPKVRAATKDYFERMKTMGK